jgi:ribosomal protein S18 acetylase RimI-like enzyme
MNAASDPAARDSGIARPRMDAGMPDYSAPATDDFESLPHDRTPVRSMVPGDLDAIVAIDAKLTGHDRRPYYQAKLEEVIGETGIRVSLIAEADGRPVGYIMARVDYGEFGRAEPTAVIDTIGVEPGHGHQGIGAALMSQLMTNLEALHVEALRTTVSWNNFSLLGFLNRAGFRPAQQLVLSLTVS